ncbi:3-hydroxymyristoyl/3-hydroxydecanoyl-(acyl carrier protein) dehydratase [Actinopolyspora lacussalsi subsp. righensis]|uniref:3-hydroxymyristoyl/3-hydroxydecanoyl-(Acyl carrier protein) dehydratase n=1 Tax=Actinopolyspora righensis TaxID=995060 RepID=A0A1I6XFX4_9ACTN|nr:polyketide synthase dehydratase domain-containing protein [Actinopolyspora righensis]SFT36922.1 3-hydroxymyristoyl/3-hydroxydecanoyl-(acyl carrier protein) dehydratase [Actinopolyspora righensis]
MDDQDFEVMPRPPLSHQPTPAPRSAAALISEQLRQATELHERFLATQASFHPPTTGTATGTAVEPATEPARTARATVELDGWYLDRAGRMTAGAVLDELLALWPQRDGALDGELTFHHALPTPGGQLLSSLTVTEAALRGEVDGHLSLHGILWDGLDVPLPTEHPGAAFDTDAVTAFAEGRPADCFTGPEWELTRAHVRSPGIGSRRTLLLREVTAFDPDRGLTATGRTPPTTWHSPAALLEGGLQAMAFHLVATGSTIHRDGWRFEPLPEASTRLRVLLNAPSGTPRYHLTLRSLTGTTAHADVVVTIDEQVVLCAEGLAVHLVADTPLPHWKLLGPPAVQRTGDPVPLSALAGLRGHEDPAAASTDRIRYDHATMLTAAWGPRAEILPDASDDALRLPGPPYLFLTRVTELSVTHGDFRPGSSLVAEYDVPRHVWFREQSGTVPVAVLMEIALQPCGLLTALMNGGTADEQLRIRNLDGRLSTVREVPPDVGSLRTTVELTDIEHWDGTTIETFRVHCEADGVTALEGTTVFALTSAEQLTAQTGLPVTDHDRSRLTQPCEHPVVDLRSRPARFFGHSARLPGQMLLMLDRLTGYWPNGGPAGLGRLRAECDVRAEAWYFKAHFFNDPVQPGSLGVEAMCQLLSCYLIQRGVDDGFRLEPVVPDSWKYRGQVLPSDALVTVELDVLDVELSPDGGHAEAEAWLWVDGRKIYHVPRLRVRVVPGAPDSPSTVDTVLDPRADTWLADHCPTWTVPAVPLMSTAELLARSAGDHAGRPVRVLRDLSMQRWLPVADPVRLRATCTDEQTRLAVWHEAGSLSRFVPVATATIDFEPPPRPARFTPLKDLADAPDPYENANLFHGPSFQYLTRLRMGSTGASGVLDAERGSVPRGAMHQGLLDAALHTIPHDALHRWDPAIGSDRLAFPHRLSHLTVYEPLPDHGEIEVEARFAGTLPDDLVAIDIQMCRGEHVLVAFRTVVMHIPIGALTAVSGPERRAYLRDATPNSRLLLTGSDGVLRRRDVERADTVPGTVNAVYGLPADTRAAEWLPHIAVKDHVARNAGVHPSTVEVTTLDDVSWDEDSATVRTP